MKLLTPLLLILAGLVTRSQAQTAADSAVAEIPLLLKPGKHLVHYIRAAPLQLTPEQQAIQDKARKAMLDNAAWFRDSIKYFYDKPDEMLAAMQQKTGLTAADWNAFAALPEPGSQGMEVYGEDSLEIIPKGQLICFRGTGSVANLDSVCLDLASNTVLYKQLRIPFDRIHRTASTNNAFHSAGSNYQYELDNSSSIDTSNMSSMHLENYEFGVQRFTSVNKTAIIFLVTKLNGVNFLGASNIILMFLLD